jgi:AAA+ superfamily predicted ATPase
MTNIKKLDEDTVDQYVSNIVVDQMEDMGMYSLKEKYGDQEHPHKDTWQVDLSLDALETAMGVNIAVEQMVRDGDMFGESELYNGDQAEIFRSAYSLYVGAKVGSNIIGWKNADLGHETETDTYINRHGTKGVLGAALERYVNMYDRSSVSDEEELLEFTEAFLEQVADECASVMAEDLDNLNLVQDVNLAYGEYTVEGVETAAVDTFNFGDATFEDVIGNDEFKDALRRTENEDGEIEPGMIDMLMGYDPDGQENKFASEESAFPTSLLAVGEPGTGKTLTLRAAATYAQELAEEYDKPLTINMMDTDVHGMYHGESAQNVKQEFEKVSDPDTLGMLFIEDIDAIFPSREDLGTGDGEDEKSVHTLLQMLQGPDGNEDRGDYIVLMTTNYPENLDDAVKMRAMQQVEAPGPTETEEYRDILELLLSQDMPEEKIRIDEDEWYDLAETAEAYEFTGRHIDNVLSSLSAEKSGGFTEDQLQQIYRGEADAGEIVRQNKEPVHYEEVQEALENFQETQETQEEMENERKFEQMKSKIRRKERAKQEVDEELED